MGNYQSLQLSLLSKTEVLLIYLESEIVLQGSSLSWTLLLLETAYELLHSIP